MPDYQPFRSPSIYVTESSNELKRTTSMLKSILCYDVDKGQYFGLVSCLYPILFPNIQPWWLGGRAAASFNTKMSSLGGPTFKKNLVSQIKWLRVDGELNSSLLRPILTVTSVWNTRETGDIYVTNLQTIISYLKN